MTPQGGQPGDGGSRAPEKLHEMVSARRGWGQAWAPAPCLPLHRDPAPSGPPLGPLRRPVERNGGSGKGRNLRQNWGQQNQGPQHGHSAA